MENRDKKDAKLHGMAIVALRAFIKAEEIESGGKKRRENFRYEIHPESGTARIIDTTTGDPIEKYTRLITDWARSGRDIRRAFIALRDAKMKMERHYRSSDSDAPQIRFTLNAITGEAFLTKDRVRLMAMLSKDGKKIVALLSNDGSCVESVLSKEDRAWVEEALAKESVSQEKSWLRVARTIEDWAKVGKAVEEPYWVSLNAAKEYGSPDGIRDNTEMMIALGIIRGPRKGGEKADE